ncbi:MAG: hypothetical protein IPP49_17705 [Saprospiraceae bacterium]|nr:hypothetical protein [Saprospiraceae bacterium]
MQRFFTKNVFLLIFSAVAVAATGQSINTLTVNSPAGIAGNYEVIRAAFEAPVIHLSPQMQLL